MNNDLPQIKEILFNIKIKGIGGLSPQKASEYLAVLKTHKSDNSAQIREIQEAIFQLEKQAKTEVKDYADYQKRQQIVDLILRLDRKTREIFTEKGLDSLVLIQDSKMRSYLEEIQLILDSMEQKPNLSEVVNMFK